MNEVKIGEGLKIAIATYLQAHYGITENKALAIMRIHQREIETAQRFGSRPYYPANYIAHIECIPHLDPCPACFKFFKDGSDDTWLTQK